MANKVDNQPISGLHTCFIGIHKGNIEIEGILPHVENLYEIMDLNLVFGLSNTAYFLYKESILRSDISWLELYFSQLVPILESIGFVCELSVSQNCYIELSYKHVHPVELSEVVLVQNNEPSSFIPVLAFDKKLFSADRFIGASYDEFTMNLAKLHHFNDFIELKKYYFNGNDYSISRSSSVIFNG